MTDQADQSGVRGFFKRLRAKINVGPGWLTTDIRELLPGRKIDAEILDELETRLITADVGVEATAASSMSCGARSRARSSAMSTRCWRR